LQALALILALLQQTAPPLLGDTVVVDLGAPAGWMVEPLDADSAFAVLWQRGDSVAVIPLCLDTLRLPALRAWHDGDTVALASTTVRLGRAHADSTYPVSFPTPPESGIPAGLPRDYTARHGFHGRLRHTPTRWPLYAAGALLLAAAAAAALFHRRRGSERTEADMPPSLEERVEALLESSAYGRGDWEVFYGETDELMRELVNTVAAMESRPLTWTQVLAALRSHGRTAGLADDLRGLAREVVLQRYAGWGSSRPEAASHIRRLVSLVRRWCR